MAPGVAHLTRRRVVLSAVAVLAVVAIAVTLAVVRPWVSTKDRSDVAAPEPGDRVLQSVDVAMGTDGALTTIGDTVVIARAKGGSDTYDSTYDPTTVVDQLPVRVLTAYRTDKGSGTDLADLKGYTGRVAITLTVQNLTVKPQQITYDVAGKSKTTTALVGAPLTVVASAALPGLDPSTVVTTAEDAADDTATNGVVSQAADGTPQVQWASILAPPQLDSTATLRLVVDAKDFQVPGVDLSVQPGLVTDPSVGALIDAAFNPKNSSELALEKRTISLVGDVNDVLGRASDSISSVRKTLDTSSKTLGTETVESLTQDTKTISTSLKTSSDNIDSLGDDLKSSLKSTQSSTLQRMSETVAGLQDLIGDTSAAAPEVTVTGTGCEATVKPTKAAGGVYASLLQVTAQLDAYAKSTDGCKAELQAAITTTIGPEDPNGPNGDGKDKDGNPLCPAEVENPSVTCALDDVQQQFAEVFKGVSDSIIAGQTAAAGLDPDNLSGSLTDLGSISEQLDDIVAATDLLLATKDPAAGTPTTRLKDLTDALAAAGTSLTDAQAALDQSDSVWTALSQAVVSLHADAAKNKLTVTSMTAQNAELATRLCAIIGTGTPGTLPAAEVEQLRAYLVTTSCPGPDGSTTELSPPPVYGAAMATRLTGQSGAWDEVIAGTDTTAADSGLGKLLADQHTRLTSVRTQLTALAGSLGTAGASLTDDRSALTEVNTEATKAQAGLVALKTKVSTTQASYVSAKKALDEALAAAADKSEEASKVDVAPAIKRVTAQGDASSEELGKAFDASASGISAAADALRDGSAKTLKKQQDELAEQQADDARTLDAQTKDGLSQVSGDVTAATRDLDSTRTALGKDLNNVLLDLGNPKKPGQGLLGTLGKSARSADSADFQLGLASDTVSSYSSVRSQEVNAILLRQAQAEASLQRQADLPAFATDLPATTTHRTLYLFHLGGDR